MAYVEKGLMCEEIKSYEKITVHRPPNSINWNIHFHSSLLLPNTII